MIDLAILFYFFAFLISIFFCAVACTARVAHEDKPKPFFFSLSALVPALVLAFREGVGTDFYTIYVEGFDSSNAGEASRFEIGYDILQRLVGFFTDDYHALFIVAGFLTVALVYVAIYRLSSNPILSVAIFLFGGLFFFSTNAVRQCIAVAIFLNALVYLFERKPKQYVVLVLLASSFHTAALCYLPLYFLRKRQFSLKAMIVLMIVVVLFGGVAFDLVFQIGSLFSSQFAQYAKIDRYFNGDFDIADFAYLVIGLGLWLLVARKYTQRTDKKNAIYASMLFIGLLFAFLTLNAAIMFRIVRLFTPVLILAIPAFLNNVQERRARIAFTVVFVVFLVASSLFLYGHLGFDSVVPYQSFLF